MRVAIFGTGRTGAELVRQARAAGWSVVAGITTTRAKTGADLGELCGGRPLGVMVGDQLDEVLRSGGVDVVLYAGKGGSPLAAAFGACADAGVDAVAVSGVVHPPTALGEEGAAKLDARARARGARLVSTGINPGLLFDVLPALLATAVPGPVSVAVRRTSSIAHWGRDVLHHEIGVGRAAAESSAELGDWVVEGAALLASAVGVGAHRVKTTFEPVLANRAAQVKEVQIEPGQVAGFRHLVVAVAEGQPRVTLEWAGAVDAAVDAWPPPTTELRIDGASPVWAAVGGDFSVDPYPSTAARVIKSIPALRELPPGLYRPDQVPISARA